MNNMGFTWLRAQTINQGSSSIEPTNSVLEAEALGLKEAIVQLNRLNYKKVILVEDNSELYNN